MSATYIVGEISNFPIKKLEIVLKDPDLQSLNSTPVLIYKAIPGFTFVPVYGFFTVDIGTLYNYNRFFFIDNPILPGITQGYLDTQQLNGGVLSNGIWTFNLFVNSIGVNGIRSIDNRDLYLKAINADDPTGSGNVKLTMYYFLL